MYVTDNSFVIQTGVSILSLLDNNQDAEAINIYLLYYNLSDCDINHLTKIVTDYNRRIIFIDSIDIFTFLSNMHIKTWSNNTYGAYVKLLWSSLLKYVTDIEKLLYIDGDTIIKNSLKQIWNYTFQENEICAAVNVGTDLQHLLEIGLNKDAEHYNTGVILFNCFKWREEECEKQIIYHIQHVRSDYPIVDQDILNVVMEKRIGRLPMNSNVRPMWGCCNWKEMSMINKLIIKNNYYSLDDYNQDMIQRGPIIIHYNNRILGKPWNKWSITPWKKLWEYYFLKSPWKDETFDDKNDNTPFISLARFIFRISPRYLWAFLWNTWMIIKIFRYHISHKN